MWSSSQVGTATLTGNLTIIAEEIRKSQQAPGSHSPLCCQVCPSDLVPDEESPAAFLFIGVGSQAMSTGAEMFTDRSEGGEKALGMAR